MTDTKNTSALHSSPRGNKAVYNVNSSMSHNASSIQEDDNLIKERNGTKTGQNVSESRFKPPPVKEEITKKYSLQHDSLPAFNVSFRGKVAAHMRSRIASILIVGLIFIFMTLVFINILLDDSLEDDKSIKDAIRAINYAQLAILGLFILEFLAKVYAFGFKGYFKDAWRVVDCLLVLATFGLVLADTQLEDADFNGMTRVRGLFRLFRVFVVIRKACILSTISKTKHRTSSLTFRSPVEKIVEILEMLKRYAKDNSLIEDLDWAIEVITANKLYEPIIDDGKGDKNGVGDWVKSYNAQLREEKKKPELLRRASVMPTALVPAAKQPTTFEISNEAREILKRDIDGMQFDVMEFKNVSGGEELAVISLWLFERHNFFELLNIKQETFIKFIRKVQAGYLPNPYHNATHAADVLQSTNYFLTTGDLITKAQFNNLEVAAMFLSSAIHDYDHPGTNNAFHMNTSSEYAIRYNDKAVLENHHVSAVFALLQTDTCNIFASFTKEDYKMIRERIIALVLATDMSTHFSDIAKLKGRLAADFDIKDKDKKFTMEIIVHAADISNPTKPWDLCREWTNRVVAEFWDQGDKERDLGLPITYLCDRYTVNLAKSQLGFIDFVVSPLFMLVKEILPKVDISGLETNKNKWKELVDFYETELKNLNERTKSGEPKEIAA